MLEMQNAIFLNRTHPLHAGNTPIVRPENLSAQQVQGEKKVSKFEQLLLGGLSTVNENQNAVSQIQEKFISDPDSVDAHDITTAMAKAQMSLSLAKGVIERIVSGWSELSVTR